MSRHTGGGTTFYAFDPQGSVSQRLDGSGAATSSDLYDAFGMVTSTASSVPDPWGFGAKWGGYTDAETGLVLLGRRYYDPAKGRFLTRDPLGYAGGRDLYAYCRNNPASLADPSGLCPGLSENTTAADDLPNRHRMVNGMIDSTETVLVTSALGAFGGGEIDLIGEEVAAGGAETIGAEEAAVAAGDSETQFTAIGRMDDLKQYENVDGINTWWDTGRIPSRDGGGPVSWQENQQWLDTYINRGDTFALVTDPANLENVYIPGKPNGYFTWRELNYLEDQGITVLHMY